MDAMAPGVLLYKFHRIRRAWWARFTFNGITRYDQGAYGLVGGEQLRDAERDQLLQLCRHRLDAFRMQRGEEVFAHRNRHRTPISGSINVRVLTRAKGRCECGGAHEHQRALEVDHIVPRNQGGSEDLSNLQAYCCRCEAGKSDAVGQVKGVALMSVGCRPATGCAGRFGGPGHRRTAAGCCWRTSRAAAQG
jgi:5-methylcytosine-specific restriction endonuclease McrA